MYPVRVYPRKKPVQQEPSLLELFTMFPQGNLVDEVLKMRETLQGKLEEIDRTLAYVLTIQKGEQGIPGEKGEPGYTPTKGVDYFDGLDGRDGVDGKDGINGIDGKDGLNGVDGKNGVDGLNGKDGKDGKNGKNGKDAKIDDVLQATIKHFEEGKIKLKTQHIDGWQDANEVVRRYVAMGSIRGGGDTVKAGSGISLTTDADGKKVITSTAGLSVLTATGSVDDSNVVFTFASAPTLVVVNGTSYRNGHGATIAGTTVTLDSPVGIGGDLYGL